ncbi:GNAT family N-acetyltransferase [Vibrio hannami]|uniref:GNAT family N-acetyltransferase n=1 Tax=Vibrio hannami TaxID=2717094 RepID=UPI003EC08938
MPEFKQINAKDLPIALLLEADPSEKCIHKYLEKALCFAAYDQGKLAGVCVTNSESSDVSEIFNIAVWPELQGRGIGTSLLRYVLEQLSDRGFKKVELGTGTFGYQLTYYQRFGFRVEGVRKNFFTDNYEQPIYEHGLQHIDMLRLFLDL